MAVRSTPGTVGFNMPMGKLGKVKTKTATAGRTHEFIKPKAPAAPKPVAAKKPQLALGAGKTRQAIGAGKPRPAVGTKKPMLALENKPRAIEAKPKPAQRALPSRRPATVTKPGAPSAKRPTASPKPTAGTSTPPPRPRTGPGSSRGSSTGPGSSRGARSASAPKPTGDPYKTLGISPNASRQQLDKAYRKLQTQSHPDLHPNDKGARARWDAAQQAYDAVKDNHKRQ
jgi:hypothetical protein